MIENIIISETGVSSQDIEQCLDKETLKNWKLEVDFLIREMKLNLKTTAKEYDKDSLHKLKKKLMIYSTFSQMIQRRIEQVKKEFSSSETSRSLAESVQFVVAAKKILPYETYLSIWKEVHKIKNQQSNEKTN